MVYEQSAKIILSSPGTGGTWDHSKTFVLLARESSSESSRESSRESLREHLGERLEVIHLEKYLRSEFGACWDRN